MYLTLSSSQLAQKKLRRELTKHELVILNYLASKDQGAKQALPAESAVMADLIRSRKTTYKEILDLFCAAKIIRHRGKFVFNGKDRAGNKCRRILLDKGILQELKARKIVSLKKITLPTDGFDFRDASEVKDPETKAVLDNLSKMTLDLKALEEAHVDIEGLVIIRKFLAGIRNVRKSPRTGRICHLLLHAGSRAVRPFFRINLAKPADVDGKSFHWQLVSEHLSKEDSKKLTAMVNEGFYESVMRGTGIKDRDVVKKKSQQVLTNKSLGRVACKIREYLFSELPSLKTYCEWVWLSGKTVQGTLQALEAEFVNNVVTEFTRLGLWIVPFYDGVWVEQRDVPALFSLAKKYIFVRKA